MTAHKCDADCWALILRYGTNDFPACDPWAARAAAEAAA